MSHPPLWINRVTLLIRPADLDLEPVRIHHVEAAPAGGAFAYLQSTSLQFDFEGGLDGLIGIPTRDRVRNVIDLGSSGRPVASDQEVVAKGQPALHAVIKRDLHSEQSCIEIARLPVIGHL